MKISSNISCLRRPYVFALSFIALFLLVESASGQSFEIRLVHPQNSEITKSKDPSIDLSDYERFFDRNEELWVSKKIYFDVSDLKEAFIVPPEPLTEEQMQNLKKSLPGIEIGPSLPTIGLVFTPQSTKRFSEFTRRYTKYRTAIILDGTLLSVSVIHEPLSSGRVAFTGDELTDKNAEAIAARIDELILLYRNSRNSQVH